MRSIYLKINNNYKVMSRDISAFRIWCAAQCPGWACQCSDPLSICHWKPLLGIVIWLYSSFPHSNFCKRCSVFKCVSHWVKLPFCLLYFPCAPYDLPLTKKHKINTVYCKTIYKIQTLLLLLLVLTLMRWKGWLHSSRSGSCSLRLRIASNLGINCLQRVHTHIESYTYGYLKDINIMKCLGMLV